MYESISSITPFTLLDFPGRMACVLWFAGCNLRCPYCHNPDLGSGPFPQLDPGEINAFLKQRKGLLEGIVLSGGECTLCPHIVELCGELQRLHFQVKIDSNGCNPTVVKGLIEGRLIDYIALDYKAPWSKFKEVAGRDRFKAYDETLALDIDSGIESEVRTTVHSRLLNETDVNAIIDDLERRGYRKRYYIQNFIESSPSKSTLKNLPNHTPIDRRLIKDSDSLEVLYRNFD